MPLYIPVDFNAAYQANQGGKLVSEQVEALAWMLKARTVTGVILWISSLLLTVLFIAVVLAGNWKTEFSLQLILLVCAVLALSGTVYGWKIWQSSKQAKNQLPTTVVTKVVGEAQKYNYGTPVRFAGATHAVILKHGYVKIGGEKYGVLNPQLYSEIVDNKKSDFYLVPIHSTGFYAGVVVNCSN